jgi:hypothetical protein
MLHRFVVVSACCALSAIGVSDVEACSCIPSQPCARASGGGLVFRAVVDSTSRTNGTTTLRVTHVFSGDPGPQVEIPSSGTTCDIAFVAGEEYLVYASRSSSGVLHTGICAGTRPVKLATDDLQLLTSFSFKNRKTAQIVGAVDSTAAGVAGIRISARRGTEVLTAVTDDEGWFVLEAPPGAYEMSAIAKGNEVARVEPRWVGIGESLVCQATYVMVAQDLRITGRVLDSRGRPVSDVPVDALRMRDNRGMLEIYGSLGARDVRTDTKGAFTMTGVRPGLYVVVVNPEMDSRGIGVGPIYAPGVLERSKVQLVEVTESKPAPRVEIRLPAAAQLTTISGRVVDANRRPVPGASVRLTGPGGRDTVHADGTGAFRLVAAPGERYGLSATGLGTQTGSAQHEFATLPTTPAPVTLVLVPPHQH